MLNKKENLVVGITTFHNELLDISVRSLGKLRQKFLLIIYNDNPTTTISKRDVRALGYRGDLQIINGTENIGTMRARIQITETVAKMRNIPEWFMFLNDNDIVVNADIPRVGPDIFAVIQNSLSLRHRVSDLIMAVRDPKNCLPDEENIVSCSPHIGICGVLVRTKIMLDFGRAITPAIDKITEFDSSLEFRPPYDLIMWRWLNDFARAQGTTPIYMNTVNYITNDIDSCTTKYGRAVMPVRKNATAVANQFDKVLAAALRGTEE